MIIVGVCERQNDLLASVIAVAIGSAGNNVLEVSAAGAWRNWRGNGLEVAVVSVPTRSAFEALAPQILVFDSIGGLRAFQGELNHDWCDTVIVPGDAPEAFMKSFSGASVISFGMSSRDTITVSSAFDKTVISFQREIRALSGAGIEEQEIVVNSLRKLAPEHLMAAVGAAVVLGVKPEDLSDIVF